MSAIDTFTHAHVANFFNLPVYWVFEEGEMSHLTDNAADDDYPMNQYSLSIGGGSGEHPALILDIDALLFRFLRNVEEIEKPADNACEANIFDYKMYKLAQDIKDKYFDKANKYQNVNPICHWKIDQNQWPLETFIRIGKRFKKETKNPNKEGLEQQIANAAALFVINEMPLEDCVEDPQLIEFAHMVRSNCWSQALNIKEIYDMFVGFTGILNCSKAGKIIRDNKVVWGYSLTDWLNDKKKADEKYLIAG